MFRAARLAKQIHLNLWLQSGFALKQEVNLLREKLHVKNGMALGRFALGRSCFPSESGQTLLENWKVYNDKCLSCNRLRNSWVLMLQYCTVCNLSTGVICR